VLTAYFVHCFGMEDAAELRYSKSDEVFLVDNEMTVAKIQKNLPP
jgi:hypothetical protein